MMSPNIKKLLPYIQILAGFIGSLLLIFVVFDNWILPSMVKDRKVVEVPKIIGMKFNDATELLSSKGLEFTIVGQQFNENYPKDYVIKQNPLPGTKVKESRQILLTISKGIESVSVPYLLNKPEYAAKNEIQNSELSIGNILYETNDSIPKGTVIRQNPAPGTKIAYDATVDLVISSGGADKIIVPDLIGKSYNEIQDILQEIGLQLGEVSYQKNETFLPNTVIRQNPHKGDTAVGGANVNVVISK